MILGFNASCLFLSILFLGAQQNACVFKLWGSFMYLFVFEFMLQDSEGLSKTEQDLKNLKEQLDETLHVGPLIRKCCTMDQVGFLTSLIFIEVDQIDFFVW